MREAVERKMIKGPDDRPLVINSRLMLGLRYVRRPYPHHRLIWLWSFETWLCQEDQTKFRKADLARATGRKLARAYGVPFRTWTT